MDPCHYDASSGKAVLPCCDCEHVTLNLTTQPVLATWQFPSAIHSAQNKPPSPSRTVCAHCSTFIQAYASKQTGAFCKQSSRSLCHTFILHSTIDPSSATDASWLSSGLNCSLLTVDVCPANAPSAWPLCRSHSFTMQSALPVATTLPRLLMAQQVISWRWALGTTRMGLSWRTSQKKTPLSRPTLTAVTCAEKETTDISTLLTCQGTQLRGNASLVLHRLLGVLLY